LQNMRHNRRDDLVPVGLKLGRFPNRGGMLGSLAEGLRAGLALGGDAHRDDDVAVLALEAGAYLAADYLCDLISGLCLRRNVPHTGRLVHARGDDAMAIYLTLSPVP
jgi:hypothetical protein